jgi:purine-binding chemotaxis protein CheW
MSEPFILFAVAGTTYALRSTEVAHVEMIEQVTPVPNAVHFVDGVVFSRGQVVPALNLRARFGFDKAPYTLATRLLIANAGGRSVGLIVDAAREFVALDPAAIQPPSAVLTGLSGRYLEGVANVGGRLILVLNLAEVLTFTDPALEAQT